MPHEVRAALRALLLFVALLIAVAPACAQPAQWNPGQPGETLEVSLVTIGPGRIYWQRFGHNAILVRDTRDGSELLYNYGIFDFTESNFLLNFLRGRMRYSMIGQEPRAELAQYASEGRWIDLQALNLAPARRAELREFLEWNRRPENAKYTYDYFLSNCSTKVRDALDRASGGALRAHTIGRSRGFTFRMQALRLTAPDFWLARGIHAGLGPYTDRPISFWEEAFVPMELARHARDVRIVDDSGASVPLVAAERRVAQAKLADPGEMPPQWLWGFALAGLALGALVYATSLVRAKAAARIAFGTLALGAWLLATIGGLLLLGLWLLTEHRSAWANENLMLFDPLCLLLLPAAFAAFRARWVPSRFAVAVAWLVAAIAGVAAFVKVLPWFRQDDYAWLALWLPVHLAFALALSRLRRTARA